MDSQDTSNSDLSVVDLPRFESIFKIRLSELANMHQVDDSPALPSCVVPGGATSPALTFKLFSKGSTPQGNYFPGDFCDDKPLDECNFPSTMSELYINARNAAARADYAAAQQAAVDAAEKAAKDAEIAAKIAFADANMPKDGSA